MAKKLRLAPEHRVAVLNAPEGYLSRLTPGPADIKTELAPDDTYDAVLLFVKDVDELRRLGPAAIHAAKPEGLLWITYPKGGTERAVGAPAQSRGATDTFKPADLYASAVDYRQERLDVVLLWGVETWLRDPQWLAAGRQAIDILRAR